MTLIKFYLKVQKRNVFGDKRVVVGGMGRERKIKINVVVLHEDIAGPSKQSIENDC